MEMPPSLPRCQTIKFFSPVRSRFLRHHQPSSARLAVFCEGGKFPPPPSPPRTHVLSFFWRGCRSWCPISPSMDEKFPSTGEMLPYYLLPKHQPESVQTGFIVRSTPIERPRTSLSPPPPLSIADSQIGIAFSSAYGNDAAPETESFGLLW